MTFPNYSNPLVANWSTGHDSITMAPTIFDSAAAGNMWRGSTLFHFQNEAYYKFTRTSYSSCTGDWEHIHARKKKTDANWFPTEPLSFSNFSGINGQVHLMIASFKTVSLLLPIKSERYAIIIYFFNVFNNLRNWAGPDWSKSCFLLIRLVTDIVSVWKTFQTSLLSDSHNGCVVQVLPE